MLENIFISNCAVIKELSCDLSEGFTVMTGETGSGKSVIIDCICFALGGKADKELVRTGESMAEVSLLFGGLEGIRAELESAGASPDENGQIFIRRTLSAEGKTAAKINSRAVGVSVLKQVAKKLAAIHGQFDSGVLTEKAELTALLDSYIGDEYELECYRAAYKELRDAESRLEKLNTSLEDREMMLDILKHRYSEIDRAGLSDPEEEEKLERLRLKLRSIEKISKSVSVVKKTLADNEKGVTACYMVDRAATAVRGLADVFDDAEETALRLDDIRSELFDISERIADLLGDCDVDDPEKKLDLVETRLALIKKLKTRYGDTVADVIEKKNEIQNRISELENGDDVLEDARLAVTDAEKKTLSFAKVLSELRSKAASDLSPRITSVLTELDMPKVRFSISVKTRLDGKGKTCFSADGKDDVEFLVGTNVGDGLQPIGRIASGGELSRIMLAVKSTMQSGCRELVSVFDEIDAGVSGATSERIGIKLSEMSASGQVICITHSAQIASIADCHLKISKTERNGRVESMVSELDREGRIGELSRIIGGISITDKQIKAAVEMLEKHEKIR